MQQLMLMPGAPSCLRVVCRRGVENTCLPVAEGSADSVLTHGRGLLQVSGLGARLVVPLALAVCSCHPVMRPPSVTILANQHSPPMVCAQVDAAYRYLRRAAELDVPAGERPRAACSPAAAAALFAAANQRTVPRPLPPRLQST